MAELGYFFVTGEDGYVTRTHVDLAEIAYELNVMHGGEKLHNQTDRS